MDVSSVARSLNISDHAVINKAKELLRLTRMKFPGGLGQGEVCKVSICLELACNMCSGVQPPSRDLFVRWGCAPKKVYMTTFALCQKVLGVEAGVPTMTELALKFGCENLVKPAEILLAIYRKRFVKSLTASATGAAPNTTSSAPSSSIAQQAITSHPVQSAGTRAVPAAGLPGTSNKTVDFSRPAFSIAALELTGKTQRGGSGHLKVNVRKVLQQLGITNAQYQAVVASIRELCAAELGEEPEEDEEEAGQGTGVQGDGDVVVALKDGEEEGEGEGRKQGGGKGRGKRKGVKNSKGKRRRRSEDEEDEGKDGEEGGDNDAEVDVDEWEVLVKVGEGEDKAEGQEAARKRRRKHTGV